MPELVGAIDQGTSSTRFMIFDGGGNVVARAQQEHDQIFPEPGWVEHDPEQIWERTVLVVESALSESGLSPSDLMAVGITNQRETTVVWERSSGRPIANAIVWQDTRTRELCERLAQDGWDQVFRDRAGLPVATYFSGPKVRWLLDEVERGGDLAFGTIDSWLAWKLTGRHVTDISNASRTLLMDLAAGQWDQELLDRVGVPESMVAEIVPNVGEIGTCRGPLEGVPLMAMLGDQHAALFGQACFRPGEAKNTYGTGNFMLLNTGNTPVPSESGLLTTIGFALAGEETVYALEGSIAVTGSLIQWLRDNLGLIDSAADVEALASSVDDNGDVYFVPAFSGLFAPYWRPDARGVVTGLTRYAERGHIARAALEAAAYQTKDVLDAMTADSGVELSELRVDGGMTANDLLMQFQADLLGVDVVRPEVTETTAMGAAFGAGLASGLWPDLDSIRALWKEDRRWEPEMGDEERRRLHGRWKDAVERSFGWV